jgi:hypothetical protein
MTRMDSGFVVGHGNAAKKHNPADAGGSAEPCKKRDPETGPFRSLA